MIFSKKIILIGCYLACFSAIASCQQGKKEKYPNSEMYDIANPTIINLPEELDEISGLAYYPKDTSVFAIIDEDGLLYKIPVTHPKDLKKWRFDKQRDYEDVLLKDSLFYVLVSNGNVEKLKFVGDSIQVEKIKFNNPSKKINEFETIYYNTDSNRVVIICKQCEEDKKKLVSSYAIRDSATADTEDNFVKFNEIDVKPIAKYLGLDKLALKPSAAAINPITKELYVLCSVSKLLLVLDKNGDFKEVYKLDPKIYKQPEGLTFTPEGDLIISNEVFLEGYATLLILKNKLKGR